MTSAELDEKYPEPTPEHAYEIALAFMEELGDLPEAVWYRLGYVQATSEDQQAVWDELHEMRKALFEGLGETMPEYEDAIRI